MVASTNPIMLNVGQVADILNCSPRHVYRLTMAAFCQHHQARRPSALASADNRRLDCRGLSRKTTQKCPGTSRSMMLAMWPMIL